MSLLKTIKQQLGLSVTPANNFTITAEADNGTMKLARGNAGATVQDILTVDVSGNVLVDGNNLNLFSAKSLTASGYQKLPSGLIIQWGVLSIPISSTSLTVSFPITYPTNLVGVVALRRNGGAALAADNVAIDNSANNQFIIRPQAADAVNARAYTWLAIGY